MLKFKKLLTLTMTALLTFSLAACSGGKTGGAPVKQLDAMTTEEITLSYASWQNPRLDEEMAKKFMEKYPNIKVEVYSLDLGGYNDALLNMASAGNLPDAFWYLGNVDIPIMNGWMYDMTALFDGDPENDEVLETMKIQGRFNGSKKLAAPAQLYPFVIYLDKNLFERENVPMPSPDWKWTDMINTMKRMTIPEKGIYGYNTFTQLVTMAPIVQGDALGEFGWDGEKYDMTKYWAEGIQTHADLVRSKVHAPWFGSDEAEAAFGARDLWAANTGKLAMQLDAWWTIDLFSTPEFVDKGINWVPYVVPQGDNAKELNKPAFVDFGAVSAGTKHPREAYELLKFMGWGTEGWMAKLDIFENALNEDGSKAFRYPIGLPITGNKEVWDGVARLLPQTPEFKAFLERCKSPIPLGGASQPGFQTFLDEVYFGGEWGNVEGAVIDGHIKAADIAAQLTEKLNQYRKETLEELFD
jgi:multiple sugar transport system substrate-binding protein